MTVRFTPKAVSERVFWVGAVDWERRMFDALIPLPDGTSYNAYLVRGSEATALVDTVDPPKADVLLARLESLGISELHYVIANHAEQDHSGALPQVLARFASAKVVCTEKAKGLLVNLLHLPEERFLTVGDGERLPLGDRTLRFIHAPWVHWPETMLTYLEQERTLFPCDLFGSHLATSELFAPDRRALYLAAKRYYAEIMMPFARTIEKHLAKVEELDPLLIAPSHGPLHSEPRFILDAYREWVSGEPKNLAAVCYVSMHGSTRALVARLVEALAARGVPCEVFDLQVTDLGKLAMTLVDAATIVLGAPTVLGGAHPSAVYAAYLANALRPKARFAAVIGSYGWGGHTVEQLAELLGGLRLELLEPVLVRGLPRPEDEQAIERLAEAIAERHRGLAPAQ